MLALSHINEISSFCLLMRCCSCRFGAAVLGSQFGRFLNSRIKPLDLQGRSRPKKSGLVEASARTSVAAPRQMEIPTQTVGPRRSSISHAISVVLIAEIPTQKSRAS